MVSRSATLRNLAGPTVLLGALLLWWVADRSYGIGPFDRAQATGFLALPLLLVSPWAASLAVPQAGGWRRLSRPVALGVGIGVVVTVALVATVGSIGCRHVTALDGLPEAATLGLMAAWVFVAATAVAVAFRNRGTVAGLLSSAIGLAIGLGLVVLTFSLAYPAASCPPV